MIPLHINLNSREAIILTAILGNSKCNEMYDLYAELSDRLSQVEAELADELTYKLINYSINEGELLDEVIEEYRNRPIGG